MMQPTVKEVQDALVLIRKFAYQDDYNLCRPYLINLVISFCDTIDVVLTARDWEPVHFDD